MLLTSIYLKLIIVMHVFKLKRKYAILVGSVMYVSGHTGSSDLTGSKTSAVCKCFITILLRLAIS